MTFQVPASKASIKQNRFEFTVPGDRKTYSIPKAKYLSVGQAEQLSALGDNAGFGAITAIFGQDEATVAAIRKLDGEQLSALMEAWQADSKVDTGE